MAPPFNLGLAFVVLSDKEKLVVIFERRVPDLTEPALARFVDRARKAVGLKGRVDVLVTSDAEMKALNGRFRRKNVATDVLSFGVAPDGKIPDRLTGEIAISADIAKRNARELGHGSAEEVKILALHGILHLAGYDHERDHGEMARREATLRAQLRLPIGLIERGSRERLAGSQSKRRAEHHKVRGVPQRTQGARRKT
jgi:probable rRNA maturation factor